MPIFYVIDLVFLIFAYKFYSYSIKFTDKDTVSPSDLSVVMSLKWAL